LFEILKPFSTTLLLNTVFLFIKEKSPLSTAATVESIFGSSYFGIGRGISGLAGGLFIDKWGATYTFRIMAIAAVGTGIVYGLATEVKESFVRD
jgi:predicted MFS family arabinose efflux permease